MQIAPGQAPLSLAVLKTLGSQAAPASTTARSSAAAAPGAPEREAAAPAGDLAAARHLPRGSFVDLRA